MSESDPDSSKKFFAMAAGISNLSPMNFQLGAVIVDKRGRIIASGHNSYKTHPKFGTRKNEYRYLHAEGAALYDAEKRGISVENCEIYVFRKGYNVAKPCSHCMDMLFAAGIRAVHFTNKPSISRKVKLVWNTIRQL